MSEQQILSLDSQVLNSIQLCARRTQYQFAYHLEPPEKAEALERGDLMHKILEVYYGLKIMMDNRMAQPLWIELLEKIGSYAHPMTPVQYAMKAGYYFASKLNIPVDECEEIIFQFREYCEYYRNDPWIPLAVESVGSKVLFEDDELKIIYNFKIDLVAQKVDLVVPWDHKTSKRRTEINSLSNQFIGYAWALGVNNMGVDKIGFQKTLKPFERFQRQVLPISPNRIQEWVDNSVFWARYLHHCMTQEQYPMNLTSCDKYSGCIYRYICEKDPELRELTIARDYKVGKLWDVAAILEAS